jgi:hypothetical protein
MTAGRSSRFSGDWGTRAFGQVGAFANTKGLKDDKEN